MLNEFILLTIAHVIAVASPGADFAVVVNNTLRSGKPAGLMTAIGVGLGISVHLFYTLIGLALVLTQSAMLFNLIRISGAFYLIWLAWGALNAAAKKAQAHHEPTVHLSWLQAARQGFLTNVFNPKVTVFFLVLFTSIVSQTTPLWIQMIYGLWLVVYTILWFMMVAWIFSRAKVLAWYETHGHYIDRGMGIFLLIIASKLLFDIF